MNNHSKDIIESIFGKEDRKTIKSRIESVLDDKVGIHIAQEGINVARDVMSVVSEAEEGEPDKADMQGTTDDVGLDPVMDREYFLKSIDIGDVLVTIKTIGVGKNKPVSVYLDNVRWEFFSGPVNAEKEARKFIGTEHHKNWLESMGGNETEEEKVDESIINRLRNIEESEEFEFDNDDNSIIIDSEQANVIVAVYETLNTNNKDSFREMLGESRTDFIRILNFSFEQLSRTGDSQDESR